MSDSVSVEEGPTLFTDKSSESPISNNESSKTDSPSNIRKSVRYSISSKTNSEGESSTDSPHNIRKGSLSSVNKIDLEGDYPGKEGREGRPSDQQVHKCPKCNQFIQAGSIVVEGVVYHPKCFTCMKCNSVCRLEFYQNVNGKFYCQNCVDKTPELYNTLRSQKLAAIEAEKAKEQAVKDEELRKKKEEEDLKKKQEEAKKKPMNDTATVYPDPVECVCIIS